MSSPRGRRMSSRQVAMRPRGPVSMKTSTISEAFAGQRALQRRAVALLDDDARDALRHHRIEELERPDRDRRSGESRSSHRARSIVEIAVSTACRNAWMESSSAIERARRVPGRANAGEASARAQSRSRLTSIARLQAVQPSGRSESRYAGLTLTGRDRN